MAIVADLSVHMMNAMNETVRSYVEEAGSARLFSAITRAADISSREGLLTQKMAKEYLLIAYGHDVSRNRERLRRSIEEFDKTLTALIDGSPDLHLLSAPKPEIRAQLIKVRGMWSGFRSILQSAVDLGKVTPEGLTQVSRLNLHMLHAMHQAMEMYVGL